MKSRLVKLELNSADIAEYLANGADLKAAVNDGAQDIEAQLVPAIEETRTKASSKKGKIKPTYDQKVFKEETTAHDGRYKVEVGVKEMSNADFVFGTLSRAIYKAGGKRSTRR